ncbi:hypothetical protein LIER_12472 [Lithospermum erythrorhizon]|uniref:Uncharacterized protein n=1 Tax=Lithospermum erythrorhizon TaxID=34254 RepID=A0AAV3PS04_LITER
MSCLPSAGDHAPADCVCKGQLRTFNHKVFCSFLHMLKQAIRMSIAAVNARFPLSIIIEAAQVVPTTFVYAVAGIFTLGVHLGDYQTVPI